MQVVRELWANGFTNKPGGNYVYGNQHEQNIYIINLKTQKNKKKTLKKIMIIPIQSATCLIDAEACTPFLCMLYYFIIPLRTNDEYRNWIQSITIFSCKALERALKKMLNLRSANEDRIVVEMIKHVDDTIKEI